MICNQKKVSVSVVQSLLHSPVQTIINIYSVLQITGLPAPRLYFSLLRIFFQRGSKISIDHVGGCSQADGGG
jgi:hypothetical protein